MSTLAELVRGDGRFDTVVRAVVLSTLFVLCAALLWTTAHLRDRPDLGPAAAETPVALPVSSATNIP